MTSTSVFRRVRGAAAVATAVAAALVLTGCGSDDSDGPSKGSPSGSSASGGNGTPDDGVNGGQGQGGISGSWVSGTGGDLVVLSVSGKEAGLFVTGGTVCSGTATGEEGEEAIELKCSGGKSDRTQGKVTAHEEKKSLTVKWEGAGSETFQPAEGGELPEGLPSGVPSGLPTGAP